MSSKELLDVLDKNDNIIGYDTKENKFIKQFISRSVAIFIKTNKGEFIIVKRSPNKKSFPNCLDLAACGNVMSGESYDEAAKKELLEELGIETNLEFLGKIYHEFPENELTLKYFTALYLGKNSGEVKLNDEFVEKKEMTFEEIENMIDKNKEAFSPGFISDFNAVKEKIRP